MFQEKSINPESNQQITNPHQTPYQLAGLYRVFFARLFDLVISSIPGILLNTLVRVKPGEWGLMMGILFASLGFILLYFVLVPFFLKGNTLGKLTFGIRLKQKGRQKVSFWALLARESYFMLIPWVVSVVFQVIAIVIMAPYANSDQTGWAPATRTATLLTNLVYLFYAIWLIFVGATVKVQAQHQALIDIKFNLYVVDKDPFDRRKKTKPAPIVLTRNDEHVSLPDQPGSFTPDQIEEIESSLEVNPKNDDKKEDPDE